MEDTIDLKKYLEVLARQWKWIAGLAILTAVGAFVASSLETPSFEATALVLGVGPRYEYEFSPRIPNTPRPRQQPKTYPDLALSDDLVLEVAEALKGQLPPDQLNIGLRGHLSAQLAPADPSLVRLTASSADRDQAIVLVNAWAECYVSYVNELYRGQTSGPSFLESQVADAELRLQKAAQALVDFQSHTSVDIATTHLESKRAALEEHLAANRSIDSLIQDARSLKRQLAQHNENSPVTTSDELAILKLRLAGLSRQDRLQILWQRDNGSASVHGTAGDQARLLDTFIEALQVKSTEIRRQIKALEPTILAQQKVRQEAQLELEQVVRERNMAREAFYALVLKLTEARLEAEDSAGAVLLASRAGASRPVATRKGYKTVLGGLFGLLVGVLGAFFIEARRHVAGNSRLPNDSAAEPS